MEDLYNPHKDPIVVILLVALIITAGLAYAFNNQLNKCSDSGRSARGEVYTVPLAPGGEQKITTHNGKIYIMIEAPTKPDKFKPL